MSSEDLKGVIADVLNLTKMFPNTISNYNELVVKYWIIYDGVRNFEDVENATPVETITRAFRKLVELGLVKVPLSTRQKRKEQEKIFKTEFSILI